MALAFKALGLDSTSRTRSLAPRAGWATAARRLGLRYFFDVEETIEGRLGPKPTRLSVAIAERTDRSMAPAKQKPPQRKRRAPSETPIGRLSLQFEQFQTQLKIFGEGMAAMETRLNARIDALRDELIARIELLELAVRDLDKRVGRLEVAFRSLDKRVGRLEVSVADIQAELRDVKASLARAVTREEHERIEARVTRLEKRIPDE